MSNASVLPGYLDPRIESLPPPPPAEGVFGDRIDGIIILVSAGDVYLAKACCASIRRWMGDISITLLVDGHRTDTSEVERLPNVHRLVAQDLMDEQSARSCTGFWVKLLVFWKSPYERFLYLDADTLVWGDVRAYAELDRYDFIAGFDCRRPRVFSTREEVERFVYDVEYMEKRETPVRWAGKELANNGVFFARRGVFPRDVLLELRRLPCWRNYEQGVLNFLRWRAMDQGMPRVTGCRLQYFPAEITYAQEDRLIPRDLRHPAIVHWICKKPKLGRRYQANDDYRRLFLTLTGRTRFQGLRLFWEDLGVWLGRHKRSLLGQKTHSEPLLTGK